jgi:hypothetical protein
MVGQGARVGEATIAVIGQAVQAVKRLGRTDANARLTTDAMAAGKRVVAITKTQNLPRMRRGRLKKPAHLASPKRGVNLARGVSLAPDSPEKLVSHARPKSLKIRPRLKNYLKTWALQRLSGNWRPWTRPRLAMRTAQRNLAAAVAAGPRGVQHPRSQTTRV